MQGHVSLLHRKYNAIFFVRGNASKHTLVLRLSPNVFGGASNRTKESYNEYTPQKQVILLFRVPFRTSITGALHFCYLLAKFSRSSANGGCSSHPCLINNSAPSSAYNATSAIRRVYSNAKSLLWETDIPAP